MEKPGSVTCPHLYFFIIEDPSEFVENRAGTGQQSKQREQVSYPSHLKMIDLSLSNGLLATPGIAWRTTIGIIFASINSITRPNLSGCSTS